MPQPGVSGSGPGGGGGEPWRVSLEAPQPGRVPRSHLEVLLPHWAQTPSLPLLVQPGLALDARPPRGLGSWVQPPPPSGAGFLGAPHLLTQRPEWERPAENPGHLPALHPLPLSQPHWVGSPPTQQRCSDTRAPREQACSGLPCGPRLGQAVARVAMPRAFAYAVPTLCPSILCVTIYRGNPKTCTHFTS